jgi:hypothetical protein
VRPRALALFRLIRAFHSSRPVAGSGQYTQGHACAREAEHATAGPSADLGRMPPPTRPLATRPRSHRHRKRRCRFFVALCVKARPGLAGGPGEGCIFATRPRRSAPSSIVLDRSWEESVGAARGT